MTRQSIPTNKEADTTDGKVGYKHPPIKSQFRKGQSGNSRGRPKGQRNLAPVLAEVLRQIVTVKQDGKAQRMSKGEALIKILLAKAQKGDSKAIKAVVELSEQIGRIQSAELKPRGVGSSEFMLVPGIAASSEEWQREIAARDEMADLRKSVAAFRARTGVLPTYSQVAALRESLAPAPRTGTSRTPLRRPVNRIDKPSLKPNLAVEQSQGEAAALTQCEAARQIPTGPARSPTGTYRPVNRRQPASPTTLPDE